MKLPVISLAILAAQIGSAYVTGGGKTILTLSNFASYYTGYDFVMRRWEPASLAIGYGPWVVKRFATAFARPRINMRGLPISFS